MKRLILTAMVVAVSAPAFASFFTLGGYVIPDNQVADRFYNWHPGGDNGINIQQSNGNLTATNNVMLSAGVVNGDPVIGRDNSSWNGTYMTLFLDETPVIDGPGPDIACFPWDGNYTGEFGNIGETDKLSIALEMPTAPNNWVWMGLDGDNGGSGLWDIAMWGVPFIGSSHTKVIVHASAGSTNWEPGVWSGMPGPYDYDGDGDNDVVVGPLSGSGSRWDSGKKQTFAVINIVPEPLTLTLLAGGLVALIRRR